MSDLKPKSPTDLKLAQVWAQNEAAAPVETGDAPNLRLLRVAVEGLTDEQKLQVTKGREDLRARLFTER